MRRSIVYLNIPEFAVEIERMRDSSLRERPVVVAPSLSDRAQLWEVSKEAQQWGVRPGMPVAVAQRACKDLIVRPPRPDLYDRANRALTACLAQHTPLYEVESLGHAYLDLSGCRFLNPCLWSFAEQLRHQVSEDLRLSSSLGISINKLVSKIAGESVANQRDICEVSEGREPHFLSPLPVRVLPLGRALCNRTTRKAEDPFTELNLHRVGDLLRVGKAALNAVFGHEGELLWNAARGIDFTPVYPPRQEPVVREEHQLPEDTNNLDLLAAHLFTLVELATYRLRGMRTLSGKVGLTLRYSDYQQATGASALKPPSMHSYQVFPVAWALHNKLLSRRVRVRHLTLEMGKLQKNACQMSLFGPTKEETLTEHLDQVRERFGFNAVITGKTLLRSPHQHGTTPPGKSTRNNRV